LDIVLYLEIVLFVILLGFSGFFSSSETSLFSLNSITLEQMRRDGNKRIDLIDRLLSEPRRLIVTILIGNELVNVAASVISAAVVIRFLGAENKLLNLVIMVPLLLLIGEITPKTLAIRHNVGFATFQSPLIAWFARLITPVRWCVRKIADAIITLIVGSHRSPDNIITEDLVRSLTEQAVGEGVLDRQEAGFIDNIFNFGELDVTDVMTPRSHFFTLPQDMPMGEMAAEIHKTRHTKVPIHDKTPEAIVGVLYARDLIGRDFDSEPDIVAAGLLREAYRVPERKLATDLFQAFQKRKISIALVIDEYGGVTGLVTLEDLLECIFGEIESGSEILKERAVKIEQVGATDYRVDGVISVRRFNHMTGESLPDNMADTLGGVLLDRFGELPAEGSKLFIGEAEYTILSVDDNRIARISYRRLDQTKEAATAEAETGAEAEAEAEAS
jgi:putative hemolysin